MQRKAIYGYVIILHLLVVLMLFKSDFIQRVEAKLGVDQSEPEISLFYKSMVDYHKRMDGSIPDGAVIFIGDSITQGLATSAISHAGVNLGIGLDTTAGVLNRLQFYKSIDRSKAVVLAIGVNDLA